MTPPRQGLALGIMAFKALPDDTDLAAWKVQVEALRRMGLSGRARMTFELCDNVRELARAGIRRRHPDYSENQVRLALMRLIFGERLFQEVQPGCDIQP